MTLLTEPTRIVLAKGYSLPDDADAVAYIAAVEAADGQALETATRMAINSFVKGCKADGIWPPSRQVASLVEPGHWLVRWFRWLVLRLLISTLSLVTTTGRLGWWGTGRRSISIATAITTLIRKTAGFGFYRKCCYRPKRMFAQLKQFVLDENGVSNYPAECQQRSSFK
jgi:hypothetical protein